MYVWQPAKWFGWALLGVGLPAAGGYFVSQTPMMSEISANAAKAAGGGWAKLTQDGRDFTVTGEASSKEDVAKVAAAVAAAAGVRTVDVSGVKIAAPPPPPPPVVEAPAMTAPTITAVNATTDHPTITGTWPNAAGNTLQVELDGKVHTLGKDADLTSAGNVWTLIPKDAVVNGKYDVIAKVTGADGKALTSTSKQDLTVNVPPPPPAPPKEQPYDCVGTLKQAFASEPVRFEFNMDTLTSDDVKALADYAKIMMDPRCKAVAIKAMGHTDYKGDDAYNMNLSVRRANATTKQLATAGVDASRMEAGGLGKTEPLDPARTDAARAVNRRVEFSIK